MNIPNMTKSFLALTILTCAHGSGTLRVKVHIANGHFGVDAPLPRILPEGWIARLPEGWTWRKSRSKPGKILYVSPNGRYENTYDGTGIFEYWNERTNVSTRKRPPFEIH